MAERIKVGMADLNVVVNPGILISLGLGSCVGVALYDEYLKVAGLAHIMLPNSRQIKNNANKAKFADTAIIQLMEQMAKLGANRGRLKAKIAGGSQMFASLSGKNDLLKIGKRNIDSSIKTLHELGIPIISQDIGGNYGRTVELYSDTGIFVIKTIGHGIREI